VQLKSVPSQKSGSSSMHPEHSVSATAQARITRFIESSPDSTPHNRSRIVVRAYNSEACVTPTLGTLSKAAMKR
jgi:hypothetical protein